MDDPTDQTEMPPLRITDDNGNILSCHLCPNYYCSDIFEIIMQWEDMSQPPEN